MRSMISPFMENTHVKPRNFEKACSGLKAANQLSPTHEFDTLSKASASATDQWLSRVCSYSSWHDLFGENAITKCGGSPININKAETYNLHCGMLLIENAGLALHGHCRRANQR